jgi:shikimate kinase
VDGVRVVLIGGTSHTGKSTTARAVARRLDLPLASTDYLARHPGRPWRTPEREVPPHVAEHYRTLSTPELIASVLAHYRRLRPRVAALVREATADGAPGLVLEGSALWPAWTPGEPGTAAVWLTANPAAVRERIRRESGYGQATPGERELVDAFTARALRFQELMGRELDRAGLRPLDAGDMDPERVADAVLAAVDAGR